VKPIAVAFVGLAFAACSSSHGSPASGVAGANGPGGSSGGAGAASGTGGAGAGGGSGSGGAGGAVVLTIDHTVPPTVKVDVVLMIDNSLGMGPKQQALIAAFPSYVSALRALPGGLPSLHLGIVSSSLGAGRNPSLHNCAPGGDQGVFQAKPLGTTCATASLAPGQSFIIEDNGTSNHTGELADVLACLAPLGEAGCGFEHQFASVLRALGADGAPAPPENANFLRPDAYLQIVLVSDEDDCSAPPDSDLFDSSSMALTDPLGPMTSYRCNEFGHLCGGKPPPRMPPGEVDLSGTCVSAEDGRLLRVADVVAALKTFKSDPSKVFVASIGAPPNPYKVNLGPSFVQGDTSMWPYVEHSCQSNPTPSVILDGDPGVRTSEWVNAFGANGLVEDICDTTYAGALQRIATQMVTNTGPACLPFIVNPSKCSAVDQFADATTGRVSTMALPMCKPSDVGPCWTVVDDASMCAEKGEPIVFKRPVPSATLAKTTVTCSP
jgi:hypothetical protein